jgi:RNA polymerase sigma factor (TIGR02999 family)
MGEEPLNHSLEQQAMSTPGEITQLLQQAEQGDRLAADRLYRLIEPDLRAIAGRRKQRYENALEASTTVLVDDAFCKLVGQDLTVWQPGDRLKFFSYVANKIHDLLVDTARAQAAQRRGGGRQRVELDDGNQGSLPRSPSDDRDFMLDMQAALTRFEEFAAPEGMVFRFRYYLGCTFDEIADILDISATEVKRRFQKAQLWLQRELKDYLEA